MEYTKIKEREEAFTKKREIVELEKFYVNSELANLDEIVEERKKEITDKLIKYRDSHTEIKYDRNNNPVEYINVTPYTMSNYFFRSVTALQNIEPKYSGEQLAILWDLYCYMVEQVNEHIGTFTPTLTHFARFIGTTAGNLKKMKSSPDEGIKLMAEKIYDACYDNGVYMAQMGEHNSRATIYRMKSELERVEKETPQETIHTVQIDLDSINKRIKEVNSFNGKVIDWQEYNSSK